MIAKSIKRRAEWTIDILEKARRIIEKDEKELDHSHATRLRKLKTQIDTALLLVREALKSYERRKSNKEETR